MVRMSDERTVKEVFLWKLDGRRKVGRPKLRWLDWRMSEIDGYQEMEEESGRQACMGYHAVQGHMTMEKDDLHGISQTLKRRMIGLVNKAFGRTLKDAAMGAFSECDA
jgi:hypothetical protein